MRRSTIRHSLIYVFVTIAFIIAGWSWTETGAVSKTEQPPAQVVSGTTAVKDAAVARQNRAAPPAPGRPQSERQRPENPRLPDPRKAGGLHQRLPDRSRAWNVLAVFVSRRG